MASNPLMRACILALATFGLAACGNSSASCDFPTQFHCIEITGSSGDVSDWKKACTAGSGMASSDSCPDANLIGCCSYHFGGDFHECFYEGFASDPETYCAGFEGSVWEPATP